MDIKIITRYSIRETMGLVFMAVALFWSAGKIDWWPGWAALAIMLLWIIATATVILRISPDLLRERLGPRKGAKRWDIVIMGLLGVFQLVRYVIAGFDERYGWSPGFSLAIQIAALIICAISYAIVVWSTASNAFFSQIVRIQPERGHRVITDGPYRFIRHPGYLGAILYEAAISFLLSSWWSLIPGGINIMLLILRTTLEDRLLQKELGGYQKYTQKVRFRLLPGIW